MGLAEDAPHRSLDEFLSIERWHDDGHGLAHRRKLLLVGPPLAWVLYTLGFLIVTRHWERPPPKEDDGP